MLQATFSHDEFTFCFINMLCRCYKLLLVMMNLHFVLLTCYVDVTSYFTFYIRWYYFHSFTGGVLLKLSELTQPNPRLINIRISSV